MALSNQIVFFDTTLRDGEQSPGCTMHNEEKLRMAHQLADLDRKSTRLNSSHRR